MKVNKYKIKIPNTGHYNVLEVDDFEYVNPVKQFEAMFISYRVSTNSDILSLKGFDISKDSVKSFLIEEALKNWDAYYKEIEETKISNNLVHLLDSKTKSEQIKSLKGVSLTTKELFAFIFMAYERYGFKYSQYKAKHNHKGLDETKLPKVIHLEDDGEISTIGETNLTKGQQRQLVECRKVVVSKFLDNSNNWHCFFLTFRSLGGKENYKNGQPHLHYISDKWGINREDVVKQLTSKDYKLPSLPHIDYNHNEIETHMQPPINAQQK